MFMKLSAAASMTAPSASTAAPFDWATFLEWLGSIVVTLVVTFITVRHVYRPAPNLRGSWELHPKYNGMRLPMHDGEVMFKLRNLSENVIAFELDVIVIAPNWLNPLAVHHDSFGKDDVVRLNVWNRDTKVVRDTHGNNEVVPVDSTTAPITPVVRITWFDSKHGKKQQSRDFVCDVEIAK